MLWAYGLRWKICSLPPTINAAGCTRWPMCSNTCHAWCSARLKTALHEIRMATTRGHTEKAFEQFVQTYEAIYPKTVQCLVKDELTYSRSVAS